MGPGVYGNLMGRPAKTTKNQLFPAPQDPPNPRSRIPDPGPQSPLQIPGGPGGPQIPGGAKTLSNTRISQILAILGYPQGLPNPPKSVVLDLRRTVWGILGGVGD